MFRQLLYLYAFSNGFSGESRDFNFTTVPGNTNVVFLERLLPQQWKIALRSWAPANDYDASICHKFKVEHRVSGELSAVAGNTSLTLHCDNANTVATCQFYNWNCGTAISSPQTVTMQAGAHTTNWIYFKMKGPILNLHVSGAGADQAQVVAPLRATLATVTRDYLWTEELEEITSNPVGGSEVIQGAQIFYASQVAGNPVTRGMMVVTARTGNDFTYRFKTFAAGNTAPAFIGTTQTISPCSSGNCFVDLDSTGAPSAESTGESDFKWETSSTPSFVPQGPALLYVLRP